jgi:hypothetical protein
MKNVLIIIGVFLSFISCNKSDIQTNNQGSNLQLNFRSVNIDSFYNTSNNFLLTQQQYINLNAEQKKILWIAKIDFLLGQGLNSSQNTLLNQLKQNIVDLRIDTFYFNTDIKNTAISLTNVFSISDYINSFNTLHRNNIQNKMEANCKVFVKTFIEKNEDDDVEAIGKPKCNCRWTCGDWPSSGTSYNCKRVKGCGFLWLQDCIGRDELMPEGGEGGFINVFTPHTFL